jgi:cellulose synthase (UDP-forming)
MEADVVQREEPRLSWLPVFPGGELPAPESRRRKLVMRGVALVAVAVSLAYLTWRLFFTIDLSSWWVSLPFIALEIHALLSLGLFTFSLWEIDLKSAWRPVDTTTMRVAVLVPTYNESREILLPTIASAVGLKPAHETWVLDDGNRPEVAELARELGAQYLAREERTDAKAGNINHALSIIDADLIAVLDADHVATPNFLRNTLGYFDDPKVALVQTPQDFYNLESFEHGATTAHSWESRPLYHEQQLFYRAIQPGKNRWAAPFWCGTGAVLRVAALREVDGVATGSVTEDIHTTIRLHRRGWQTVYHNEVLARGLAAETAEQFQLQRLRWGTGAMQVLRQENPLFGPDLTLSQRLAYASTLLGWFEAWRSLGYLLIPIAVLFTGGVPVRAPFALFAVAFMVTFTLQQTALRLLSRSYHRPILPVVFDLVRMTPNLLATLTLLRPAQRPFRVTPKGRQTDSRARIGPPRLLLALTALSVAAAVWFLLTIAGLTPLSYDDPRFAYGAAFWLTINGALLLIACGRANSQRYGPERRSGVRLETALAGTLDGRPCAIHELSITGAQVSLAGRLPPLDSDKRHGLAVSLLDETLGLGVVIRWQRPSSADQTLVGVEFVERQTAKQARLFLALLNGQILLAPEASLRRAA